MDKTSANSPVNDPDEASTQEFVGRQPNSANISLGRRITYVYNTVDSQPHATATPSPNGQSNRQIESNISTRRYRDIVGRALELREPASSYVRDGSPFVNEVTSATKILQAESRFMNIRFLPKEADTYRLETFKKNRMIIFNQIGIPGYRPRYGTKKDVEALTACFEKRGFDVSTYEDCTKDQIYTIMDDETNIDLSLYGCFAVVVLTHGSDDGMLMTKDHPIYERDIIDYLKGSTTPSLITKPRLLIVQACRGTEVSTAVLAGEGFEQSISRDSMSKLQKPYKMANETDLLLLHSAYPGMVSHRGELEGTWFIQSLCRFINISHPNDDILAITRQVIHDVSINYEVQIRDKESGVLVSDKQVPVVTTTLSRKLCLNTNAGRDTNSVSNSIETQIKMEGMNVTSSFAATDSSMVETEEQIVFRKETYTKTSHSSAIASRNYETEDFRIRYFDYVRDVLSNFVDGHVGDREFLRSAVPLLHIARTIDCNKALSKTREETCLQIITLLQGLDFSDKELIFLYKYS